jgi:hypothetical protein
VIEDPKVQTVPKVLKGFKVTKEIQEPVDHKACRAILVHKVIRETQPWLRTEPV